MSAPLLDALRAGHRARSAAAQVGMQDTGRHAGDTAQAYDFAKLPAYAPVLLQKAAARALNVASPFFRVGGEGTGPEIAIDGTPSVSFASYNYLGLNGHPEVMAAAHAAIDRWGVSPSASRLVGGERPCHATLEAALATLYGTEAALAFVSGHATNVTVIGALLGPTDLIVTDALAHNSVMEGARLSGASRLTMPHNDLDWLDETLGRVRGRHRHVLICVEGLYSMDGDSPDLARLVEIKARHDAWLMVDEAHALGVLGATGRGLAERQGICPRSVEIWMGTLSKTLASCGGYVAGSAALVDYLRTQAAGFVYSVGLAAPLAATAEAAIGVMLREPERVARLQANGAAFRSGARAAGLDTGLSEGFTVTPVLIGDSLRAVRASQALHAAGINALPIIHPAVPERQARLRFFLTSEHTAAQIETAVLRTAEVLGRA